ncbi:MAG: porin [Alphaproteobacteria bacterium]
MKKIICALILLPTIANAQTFDYSIQAKSLYGYSTQDNKSHLPTNLDLNLSYTYDITTFYLDINTAFDKANKDYNQGSWGEEFYAIIDTETKGQFQIGQMYNVAKQFYSGSQNELDYDISDFVTNSSWQRNNSITKFSTFNTTAINTDGVAPKISYITPEFYNSYLGFSYTPDSYNRRGLTNKEAKEGYISSILNYQDWGAIDIETSLSYAYFEDLDKEYSASIKFSYGNWSLMGGYRKSDSIGDNITINDGYRNATAYDIGFGYEIGPYKALASYLNTKSNTFDYTEEIYSLNQSFQYNKYLDIYLIGAYTNYNNQENKEGYTFITGIKINL